jgi:hypothetical protein
MSFCTWRLQDAGHPISVDPVTADTLHESLLIFPELA